MIEVEIEALEHLGEMLDEYVLKALWILYALYTPFPPYGVYPSFDEVVNRLYRALSDGDVDIRFVISPYDEVEGVVFIGLDKLGMVISRKTIYLKWWRDIEV